MIANINFRDGGGKFANGSEQDVAFACFDHVSTVGAGWNWLRNKLAQWCLTQATEHAFNVETADLWISRYQALRGIK